MENMTQAVIRGICIYWIRMCWEIRHADAWCNLQYRAIILNKVRLLREMERGPYVEHMAGYDRPLALRGVPAFTWDARPSKLPSAEERARRARETEPPGA